MSNFISCYNNFMENKFKILTGFLSDNNIEFSIIGAYALYAYGYIRATKDIDFITKLENQAKIVQYLESIGFETLNKSEGFSNHIHNIDSIRIDIVYVDNKTADIILKDSKKKIILENLELPVVSPKHLIALKLFAIKNEPSRKNKELADIKELVKIIDMKKEELLDICKEYEAECYINEIIED